MFVAAAVPARATDVAAIVVPAKVAMFVAAAVPSRATEVASIVVPAKVAMFVAAAVPARATDVAAIVAPENVGVDASSAETLVTISETVAIESVRVSLAKDAEATYPNAAAVTGVTVTSGLETVPSGVIAGIVTLPSGV